ncbi:MAG: protein of unknown function YibQ [Pseudomonas sp.]|nr:protein of unknown function YibQ [Pseudomonas sp.]
MASLRCLLSLFGWLCAGVALAAPVQAAKAPLPRHYMSVIIDDLGQNPERDNRVLALPGPVALAIMPDTPHASDFARQGHRAGKTVILHMPMDPATGPYAWHPGTPLPELARRLEAALAKVPHAIGINNHMGSRMTSQVEPMAWLMAELQRRHLFFVDSRTSAATVAAARAQAIGLAHVSRDVFLDDVRTPEAIAGAGPQAGIGRADRPSLPANPGCAGTRDSSAEAPGHRTCRPAPDDRRTQQPGHARPRRARPVPQSLKAVVRQSKGIRSSTCLRLRSPR